MASYRCSLALAPTRRRNSLNFENISSIGLKSGLYGGNGKTLVNGGGKVQRGAGETGDTRYSGYLAGGLLSMDCEATPSDATGSTTVAPRRRLASLSR